jgi:hypothetical protein
MDQRTGKAMKYGFGSPGWRQPSARIARRRMLTVGPWLTLDNFSQDVRLSFLFCRGLI